MITVHYDKKPIYSIVFGRNFLDATTHLKELDVDKKRVCIVTDSTVASYYLKEVEELFSTIARKVTSFVFPAGEENKQLSTIENLYEHLINHQFDRKDLLVALGGGVVGDMTGYAAATYLRGISFIQMPTTLLSQVDSSIGGKTGVDFKSYKNMVGAFYQPSLVYMNLSTLKTLTKRQYIEGMGEIIKHSLIKDASYYSWLKDHKDEILELNLDVCEEMIERSCQIKRQVVENDPTEKGERGLLNFGHTLGHAIEKEKGFSLLHGECVALGCVSASWISYEKGLISKEDYEDIIKTFEAFKLPIKVEITDSNSVLEAVKHDKKMEAGIIKFILLKKLGKLILTEVLMIMS
ncbi:3-dehydroquinate synthase [Lachnospiraceae bacterium TWA4]|nr:3-dehydroquinate synthase [Lachnospiraceae bacterium TWA4]